MVRGVRWYLVGSVVLGLLGVLAGCSGGSWFVEREPWRHQAEVQCINSGAVKEGSGVVRIKSIQGPGMCGADFPLRVSTLAESAVLGYGDEFRPPAGIPSAAGNAPPRWPIAEPRNLPPAEVPLEAAAPRAAPAAPRYDLGGQTSQPLSLEPPRPGAAASPGYDFRNPYQAAPPASSAVSRKPLEPVAGTPSYDFSPEPYDRRPALEAPRTIPRQEPQYDAPRQRAAEPPARPAPLGPARSPQVTGAVVPVTVSPAATLACPLVSALDHWILNTVQPAAMRWFGQPVVEIKQISAYSCRGMNGNPNARISEHAFGNALDIAAFTLADGRKITVKTGWHGQPEEQGFLRDVQGGACEQFTTVLAPGSNVYHYDHIHVDLMRRRDGHQACNPRAVSGEEIAARARRSQYAGKRGDPSVTGSITPRRLPAPPKRLGSTAYSDDRSDRDLPDAVPGDDGED